MVEVEALLLVGSVTHLAPLAMRAHLELLHLVTSLPPPEVDTAALVLAMEVSPAPRASLRSWRGRLLETTATVHPDVATSTNQAQPARHLSTATPTLTLLGSDLHSSHTAQIPKVSPVATMALV